MINKLKPFLVMLFITFFIQNAQCDDLVELINKVSNLDVSAIEEIEKLSTNNNEYASFLLSQLYYDGVLVEKDEEMSLSYLSRIKFDKKLLGEKLLLMATWETDKDEYDHQYVISLLKEAIQFNNKGAAINLAQELVLDFGELDKAMALSYDAMSDFQEGRVYQQFAAILYLYGGLKKAEKSKDWLSEFASKEEFGEALGLLKYSGNPFKYLILWRLMNYKMIKQDHHLKEIYMLLVNDLNYISGPEEQKIPTLEIELRNRSTKYLAKRAEQLNEIEPEFYGYCNQYTMTNYNKCLRLVDVITGICQWPSILEDSAKIFSSSQYTHRCKNLYFVKFNPNIKEW